MGTQQQFSLRWNDHQVMLLSLFDSLLQNEAFVDVTLACDGQSLKAHKVVLSACSPYFQQLLLDNPCPHPIVILKDVNYVDLKALVEFMYKGEVKVLRDQLQELVKTAELLKIRGLSEGSHTASVLDTSVSQKHNNSRTEDVYSDIVEHASATSSCSRPSKRKRMKRKQTSGSASANQDNVLEVNEPPEMIESIMDMPQSLGNCDGGSQPAQCYVSSGMLSPKVDPSDHASDPDVPEQNIHEVLCSESKSGYWFRKSQSPQCNISTEMLISDVKTVQDSDEGFDPENDGILSTDPPTLLEMTADNSSTCHFRPHSSIVVRECTSNSSAEGMAEPLFSRSRHSNRATPVFALKSQLPATLRRPFEPVSKTSESVLMCHTVDNLEVKLILYDGYRYRRDKFLADGSTSWRCSKRGCSGRIKYIRPTGEVIVRSDHNSCIRSQTN